MTNWSTSVETKGWWDEEGVIPSEANGRVEESMESLVSALARKPPGRFVLGERREWDLRTTAVQLQIG